MQKLLALSFFTGGVATDTCDIGSEAMTEVCRKFQEFENAFAKEYEGEWKRLEHYAIFAENLAIMEAMSLSDPSAKYSHLTPFADVSQEAFKARNKLRPSNDRSVGDVPTFDTSSLPEKYDWRENGAVNPIQNQGQCGSCWAFSTVANIEGVHFVQHNKLIKLSEQELVSCDHSGDNGCEGGLMSNADEFLIDSKKGLEREDVYPYTADDSECKYKSDKAVVFISAWTKISTNEDQIAAALVQYGPLSIAINAGPMQFYFGGVTSPPAELCDPTALDHGVNIVGFNVDAQYGPYWIVRNHWGSSWGEQGYYWPARGKGICGLNTMVTTVTATSDHAESDPDESGSRYHHAGNRTHAAPASSIYV